MVSEFRLGWGGGGLDDELSKVLEAGTSASKGGYRKCSLLLSHIVESKNSLFQTLESHMGGCF